MKRVLLIFVFALFAYFIGWWAIGVISRLLNGQEKKRNEQIRTTPSPETIRGRFVLSSSNCAGFEFIGNGQVLWRNEDICMTPDTLSLTWTDDSTFMTRTRSSSEKKCPPVVNVYKIVSFNGSRLKLMDFWTGWGDFPAELMELNRP